MFKTKRIKTNIQSTNNINKGFKKNEISKNKNNNENKKIEIFNDKKREIMSQSFNRNIFPNINQSDNNKTNKKKINITSFNKFNSFTIKTPLEQQLSNYNLMNNKKNKFEKIQNKINEEQEKIKFDENNFDEYENNEKLSQKGFNKNNNYFSDEDKMKDEVIQFQNINISNFSKTIQNLNENNLKEENIIDNNNT